MSKSKSAILIILWTVFTGAAYATLMIVATPVIVNNYQYMSADREVTYPVAMLYTGMAIVATLYPVIGLIADVSCGRFKVVIGCFSLIVVSYLVAYICLVADLLLISQTDLERRAPPPIIVIASIAVLLIFIGFAGYQVNFIQLGLDQLITALFVTALLDNIIYGHLHFVAVYLLLALLLINAKMLAIL